MAKYPYRHPNQNLILGAESICLTCFHKTVCRGIGNQPCAGCDCYEPTKNVKRVMKGNWITPPRNREYSYMVDFFECPFCGYIEDCETNYCPGCGSEMGMEAITNKPIS